MAKILVVDDQDAVLKTIEAILKKAGHEVMMATDGYVAQERIASVPDLVITDISMPGISGYDLVKAIRINERTKNIPVVMLSARNEKRDVQRAMQLKVDDYIVKPVDPEVLLAKIAALLRGGSKGEAGIPVSEPGEIKVALTVTSIAANDISFESAQPFPVGTRVQVSNVLFTKLGIASVEVRVLSCHPKPPAFVISAQYVDLKAMDAEAIKNWVSQNTAKKSA